MAQPQHQAVNSQRFTYCFKVFRVAFYFIYLNRNCGRKAEKTLLDPIKDSEEPTIFTQYVYLALSEELISASRAAEFLHVPLYDVMQNMRVE